MNPRDRALSVLFLAIMAIVVLCIVMLAVDAVRGSDLMYVEHDLEGRVICTVVVPDDKVPLVAPLIGKRLPLKFRGELIGYVKIKIRDAT